MPVPYAWMAAERVAQITLVPYGLTMEAYSRLADRYAAPEREALLRILWVIGMAKCRSREVPSRRRGPTRVARFFGREPPSMREILKRELLPQTMH